ncbi:MAG: hypothetical protein ACYTFY_02725 [Planctomycetota bacterium]
MSEKNRIPKGSKVITYNQLSAFWLKHENKLKRIIKKDGEEEPANLLKNADENFLTDESLDKKDVADRFEALLDSLRKILNNKNDKFSE